MSKIEIPLSHIEAAIFDMDGTMINNMGAHKKAWKEFLKRHNISLSDEEFSAKLSGKKNDAIIELLFGVTDPETVTKMGDEKEALYREIYQLEIEEIAGLSDVITELQDRGIKTAIATTANTANREFVLGALGLDGRFEAILGEEHASQGKPHPEIYLETAVKLGVEPGDCLVFEDSPPGVQSGKAAGMTVVGILSTHTVDEIANADYHINDFTEIRFV